MDQRSIQSIEIGAKLLAALVDRASPATLGQLAKDAGMASGKAHPYMVSFCRVGLAQQDEMTSLYELGPFALQMGLISLQLMDPVRIALPEISNLSATLGHTVALAVLGSHGPTIVYISESSQHIHVNMRKGTVMSVMYTATGRVFSAHLPPQTVEKMITRELADDDVAGHQKKRPAKEALAEMFEEVRRKGLARTIGQPVEGINAMSAPVFNQSRNIELAVTAIGPKGSFDAAWDGQIAEELRACAYKISSRLGYRA